MGQRQEGRVTRVVVVGGPCGRLIIVPNSARKRGWSSTKVKWRFEKGEELPLTVPCGGVVYELREEEGKLYYVPSSTPMEAPGNSQYPSPTPSCH